MRIWDIKPNKLCRNHLLGEHRELHAIWSVITKKKIGYSKHPETLRWHGKLKALFERHEALVAEMVNRKYKHGSTLEKNLAVGMARQNKFINSREEQVKILKQKKCACRV